MAVAVQADVAHAGHAVEGAPRGVDGLECDRQPGGRRQQRPVTMVSGNPNDIQMPGMFGWMQRNGRLFVLTGVIVMVASLGGTFLAQSTNKANSNNTTATSLQPPSVDIPRIGDFSLNVTNKITAHEVLSRGLIAFTPSFDLDADQLTALLDSPFAPFAEVVVHHPMPDRPTCSSDEMSALSSSSPLSLRCRFSGGASCVRKW